MSTPAANTITRAHDGARILWRRFRAADDTVANEGYVREFNRQGDYVRLAHTDFKDDAGLWLRVADLVLIDVLAEHVQLRDRPVEEKPRRRRKGPKCPGEDESEDLGLGGGGE